MKNNCQPSFHELPDGTLGRYVGTLICADCANRIWNNPGVPLLGKWGRHITLPSGNYRLFVLDASLYCLGCGVNQDAIRIPCGESPLEGDAIPEMAYLKEPEKHA